MSSSKEKEDKKEKEANKSASDILSVLKEAISVKLHEMLDEETTFDLIDSDFIMDYMMLVASSRDKTKSKIIEDLNFILNEKTEEFVNWYLDIWQKLSKVSTSKSLAKKSGGVAASLFQQVTNDLKRKYKDRVGPTASSSEEQVEKLMREDVTIKMESDTISSELQSIPTSNEHSSLVEKTALGEGKMDVNTDNLYPLPSYESIERSLKSSIREKEHLIYESSTKATPLKSSVPTEVASDVMQSSDFEEDVLIADTGDLNVSPSSSSSSGSNNESDSMSLDSCEYKAKQIYTKVKVHQWLKRRHDEENAPVVKRQKLVSTIRMLEPESATKPPTIPSIIAPPPSNRCVVPSQILLRAMRDANKSTVSAAPTAASERGSKNTVVKQRSQEAMMDNIRMTVTNHVRPKLEDVEVDQNLQSPKGSDADLSDVSQNDLEYYYENNDDLEYESDGDKAQPNDSLDDSGPPRSPTFVVTMNKDHDEYLAAIQRNKKRNSARPTASQERNSGEPRSTSSRTEEQILDKRIVKVSGAGKLSEYRTRAMSDEDKDMDTLENFKRFKKLSGRYEPPRYKRKFASSESSEDECQTKIHKSDHREEPNLPVDKLKLDSKSCSEEPMMTPPPYPATTPMNAMSDYYSTMEEWIADPNHPMALHLPPPMPPGFLPPPPPAVPPPMPPGFLPPPSSPAEAPPRPGNGYEINVKVPAQNNNNLITVQCQNLDFSSKQSSPSSDKVLCKFYPNCTKLDCPFFHRTKCTTFPACRFGQSCAYVHPACKFGSACSRVDCVFDHSALKTKTTAVPAPVNTSDVCKFHPKCLNVNCVFFHPKICMYSSNCRNKGCVFFHPAQEVPSIVNKTILDTSRSKINNKFTLRRSVLEKRM